MERQVKPPASLRRSLDRELFALVENGSWDALDALVSAGANVNQEDGLLLRWVSAVGSLDGVKKLLAMGADIHLEDDIAVREAARHGHIFIVRHLVGVGAKVTDAPDGALHWASLAGHIKVCDFLRTRIKQSPC